MSVDELFNPAGEPDMFPEDRKPGPLNVEFGAGGNRPAGYICHDIEVDITKKLPYADNSVDKIRAEHVFEHISPPDGLRFLDECMRILKPGGKLRLCVPAVDRIMQRYWLVGEEDNERRTHLRDIILNHGHLAVHTRMSLSAMLDAAGFSYTHGELKRDENDGHWKVIGEEKDDIETCRIEAIK
jgi:predicted SAM-dependent methyltransferase